MVGTADFSAAGVAATDGGGGGGGGACDFRLVKVR